MATRGSPGLKSMSVEERRAYFREATRRWRERNPGYRDIARQRRLERIASETPEQAELRRAAERAYAATRRPRIAECARERRKRDPEKFRASEREYYARNIEHSRKRARASAKRNYAKRKPAVVAANKLRRARMKGADGEPVRILRVAERDDWRCHLCGGDVTRENWSLDHLAPLARGGSHTYENIALAHRLCNVRRGVRPVHEFSI